MCIEVAAAVVNVEQVFIVAFSSGPKPTYNRINQTRSWLINGLFYIRHAIFSRTFCVWNAIQYNRNKHTTPYVHRITTHHIISFASVHFRAMQKQDSCAKTTIFLGYLHRTHTHTHILPRCVHTHGIPCECVASFWFGSVRFGWMSRIS